MDPLSLVTGSLALGSAVNAALAGLLKLRSLKDCHATIRALMVELEDCRIILGQIQALFETRQKDDRVESSLADLAVFRCHLVLKDFEQLLRKFVRASPQTRCFRWLIEKDCVMEFRQSLQNAKITLLMTLLSTELADSSGFRSRLDEIQASAEVGREDVSRLLSKLLEEQTMMRLEMRTIFLQIEQLQDRRLPSPPELLVTDAEASLEGIESHSVSTGEEFLSDDSISSSSTCTACCCRCHYRFRLDSPRSLAWLTGSSLLTFSGLPWSSCSEVRCQRQQQFKMRYTYRLPRWLVSRMFNLSYSSSSHLQSGLNLNITLRLPRVVPDNAEILRLTAQGNRKGLEALFSKGAASPHDVGSVYGLTPLHIALFKRNFALCEFLLTAGADPYLNTGMRRCVIDIVREDILRQQLSLDEIVYLKRLFVDVDDLGSFNFTAVHKAALGLSPLSLESLLQTSTSLIDAQDSQGRTALLWAASSSNVHATAVLLRHGASPHIATRTGQSPLHHAVEYGSPQCARLLLAAGAAVDHPNRRGRTPLHYASRLADNAAMCRLLLDGGADVRVRDRGLSTPLHEAVQYDRQPQIRALVDAGADLLALDADGRTPLDLAQDHSDPALDASTRCSNNPVHNERQLNSCLEDSPMAIDQDDFSSSSSSPSSAAEPPPSSSIPLQGTRALPFVYRHYADFGDLARVSGNRGLLACGQPTST